MSIAKSAFSGCKALTDIVLPEKMTSIGDGAFGGCISLKSIVLPENVQYVGEGAFSNCSALSQVTFTSVEPSVLGLGVFDYCPATLQLLIPAGTMDAYSTALGWSEYVQYLVESTE